MAVSYTAGMFVPCPHCGFLVALIVSRPGAAQRCPRCGQPLQLDDTIAEEGAGTGAADAVAEQAPPSPAPAADGAAVADSTHDVEQHGAPQADETNGLAATSPDTQGGAAGIAAAASAPSPVRGRRSARARRGTSAPSFARRSISMFESGPRRRAIAVVVALLALLATQLLLSQRHALAADAGWRPTVAALCNVLGCQLRPWHEPQAFTMLARDVRPAGQDGVLQVQASFRNDARWPQRWPHLLLRLNDRHGRTVGERLFTPDEYLGRRMSTPELLAPGQSASVRFAVREPAKGIVAFDFGFR
jgi:hypothetical protein